MGLGSEQPRRKIYYLGPRAQKIVNGAKIIDPHFVVEMRDENGAKHKLPEERRVSGKLLSIGHGEYEYPKDSGKKIKSVHLYLIDGASLFKVEGSVNSNMLRSLMNTVAGTQKFGVMEIALYVKDGFPNLFVSNDNQKTEWRFDYKKELAPLITEAPDPQDETKTVKIYHTVNKMLWEAWIATEPIVAAHAKVMGYDKMPAPAKPSTSETPKPGTSRPPTEERSLQDELDEIKQDELDPGGTWPVGLTDNSDDLPF